MTVAIAAVGARTAVGYTAAQSAAAVRAGIANFNEHPSMVDARGAPMVLAGAPGIPDTADIGTRLALLLEAALDDLAAGLPGRLEPLPMVLGLPAERPGLPAALSARVTSGLGGQRRDRVKLAAIESLHVGHAGGLMVMARGIELLRQGAPLVLVAAADSWVEADSLEWLDGQGRLHAPAMPWGFVPGEAAGCCLLTQQDSLAELGLRSLAHVAAVAAASEPHPLGSDTPCIGTGLTKALHEVLAEVSPHGIGAIYCDLNGERHRADEAGFALVRISRYLQMPEALIAPADCWGDIGVASVVLFATLAAMAWQRGYAQGERALICAGSDGPERAAFLLAAATPVTRFPTWP